MRRFLLFLLVLCMIPLSAPASATILPASGVDEDFRAWTGIECVPAVVLCESLSVLDNRGDQGGKPVETLRYAGNATLPVIESWDGYARIYYADGTQTGWVRSDYLMMDPAWYLCEEAVQVYAYPDVMAPRVALLEADTKLPILTQYADGNGREWVCVSLRSAAGWIRKTPRDTASQTGFRPELLSEITGAVLRIGSETIRLSDESALHELSVLLTSAEDHGSAMAGCPFTATLTLTCPDDQQIELQLATDSCCVYRIDSRDYSYARHLFSVEEGSPDNSVLYGLFGLSADAAWAND